MAYDDAQLTAVLNDSRRIAIVGLSRRIESPSNEVAAGDEECEFALARLLSQAVPPPAPGPSSPN